MAHLQFLGTVYFQSEDRIFSVLDDSFTTTWDSIFSAKGPYILSGGTVYFRSLMTHLRFLGTVYFQSEDRIFSAIDDSFTIPRDRIFSVIGPYIFRS